MDYLPKRYPTLFKLIDCEGGGIWNKVTDEKITGIQSKTGVDALVACSKYASRSLPVSIDSEIPISDWYKMTS